MNSKQLKDEWISSNQILAAGHPADAPLSSAVGAESEAAAGEATPLPAGPVKLRQRVVDMLDEARALQRDIGVNDSLSDKTYRSILSVRRGLDKLKSQLETEAEISPAVSAERSGGTSAPAPCSEIQPNQK